MGHKPKKGRMPPALARYWASKGRGGGGGGSGGGRKLNSRRGAAGKPASVWGKVKVLEFLAFLGAGYYANRLVLPAASMMYSASHASGGKYAAMLDNIYSQGQAQQDMLGQSGSKLLSKLLGLGIGAATTHQAWAHGVSSKVINVGVPLTIGLAIDAPDRIGGGGGGGMSRFG